MSKPRYDWWGYVKKTLYRYPDNQRPAERRAIEKAIQTTRDSYADADERLELVRLIYWSRIRYNIPGAALALPGISEATAKRWHRDFLKAVAGNLGLVDGRKK